MSGFGENSYGSRGGGNTVVSPEDMRQEYERLLSGKGLTKSLEITTDKDGKAKWMFMTLPADVAGLLEYGLNVMKPWLNQKGIDFLYKKTESAWKSYSKSDVAAHKAGLNAAKIFTAVLVGSEPVNDLVRIHSDYRSDRRDLFKSIAPALDASDGRKKNNEVIKKSLDRVHGHAMTNLKKFAADLPTLALISTYAVLDYGALRDRKTAEFKRRELASKPESQTFSELDKLATQRQEFLDTQEHKFFEEYRNKKNPRTGKNYEDAEIEGKWNTKKEEYIAGFRAKDKIRNSIPQEHTHNKSSDRDTTMLPAMIGVGGLSQILKSRLDNADRERPKIALDLIMDLQKDMDQGHHVNNLNNRITEIFQQNERDHGRDVIGPKLLPQLEPAIGAIADVINDGRLNPLALINLVGEGGIIVRHDGMRSFATAQQADELINKQLKILSSRELMKAEEFFANFADPQLVEQTLKTNLSSMQGVEKAMFASLFPEDILLRAGLKKREIVDLHKEAHEHMYGFVAASVIALAKKDPEYLINAGITENDIDKLKDFSKQLESEGLDAAKSVVDGKDKTIIDIVRTAGLNEQISTGKNPWVERVKSTKDTHEKLDKVAADNSADDNAEPRRHASGDRDNEEYRHRKNTKNRGSSARERVTSERNRDTDSSDGLAIS